MEEEKGRLLLLGRTVRVGRWWELFGGCDGWRGLGRSVLRQQADSTHHHHHSGSVMQRDALTAPARALHELLGGVRVFVRSMGGC